MKNKTTITVETWNQTIVRKGRQNAAICQLCGTETRIFTPEETSSLAQITMFETNRRIENGTFHIFETHDGSRFVCGNSLREKSEQPVIRFESRL